MNSDRRRISNRKVRCHLADSDHKKQLRFDLPPNLHRETNLRKDLKLLSLQHYETVLPNESSVWLERYDVERPLAVFTCTERDLWDVTKDEFWSDCSSLRISQGALLDRLLEQLHLHECVLHTFRIARFDKCDFPFKQTILKHTIPKATKYRTEDVKIVFTYYAIDEESLKDMLKSDGLNPQKLSLINSKRKQLDGEMPSAVYPKYKDIGVGTTPLPCYSSFLSTATRESVTSNHPSSLLSTSNCLEPDSEIEKDMAKEEPLAPDIGKDLDSPPCDGKIATKPCEPEAFLHEDLAHPMRYARYFASPLTPTTNSTISLGTTNSDRSQDSLYSGTSQGSQRERKERFIFKPSIEDITNDIVNFEISENGSERDLSSSFYSSCSSFSKSNRFFPYLVDKREHLVISDEEAEDEPNAAIAKANFLASGSHERVTDYLRSKRRIKHKGSLSSSTQSNKTNSERRGSRLNSISKNVTSILKKKAHHPTSDIRWLEMHHRHLQRTSMRVEDEERMVGGCGLASLLSYSESIQAAENAEFSPLNANRLTRRYSLDDLITKKLKAAAHQPMPQLSPSKVRIRAQLDKWMERKLRERKQQANTNCYKLLIDTDRPSVGNEQDLSLLNGEASRLDHDIEEGLQSHRTSSSGLFEQRLPKDFGEQLLNLIRNFIVRKEQVTRSHGFQTSTSLTINRWMHNRYGQPENDQTSSNASNSKSEKDQNNSLFKEDH